MRLASHRIARTAAPIVAAVLIGAAGTGIATALGPSTKAATASSQSPAHTIAAGPISRVGGTLRPGSAVRAADLGHRVFVDALHGFALASVAGAQYPAASVDAGKTWRVSGPALHLDAAQAPLVVCEVGAVSRRVYFADGCGGETVDTTSDGGRHWWRAFFGGGVQAVVGSGGRLVAFVAVPDANGSRAVTWVYVSSDGGRHWRYESDL
jgi:hypothetical protein